MKPSAALLVLAVAWLEGCARHAPGSATAEAPSTHQIRLRPADPLPVLGPDARIDRGLRAAAEELASSATTPEARLTPDAIRLALGRAGYPGDARFLRVVGGEALPDALLAALPRGEPIDVGWAWRDLPDGHRWWVIGWAPRRYTLDPVARDLPLDGALALRVDGLHDGRLLVAAPDGRVEELGIEDGRARWVDRFHMPGEHRVEVIDGDRVALLFSVYVEEPPAAPGALPSRSQPESGAEAEAWLAERVNTTRLRAGLAPLRTFAGFEPHARAHSTCLLRAGVVAHATSTCPGVTTLARATHFPAAKHHEDVAAGDTVAELWSRIEASPGHLQNVLCASCTHLSVGVVSEPTRLFATLELLEFPAGEPRENPKRR